MSTPRKSYEELLSELAKLRDRVAYLEKLDSELKNAQEELRKEKEYYRSFVESLSDWVWEMDVNGVHTYSNKAVKDILGYEPEEIIGKNTFDLWPDELRTGKARMRLKRTLASGKGWKNFPGCFKHKDGHVVVTESTAIPIFDAGGKLVGYRGIDHDITERKKFEDALRRSEQHLRSIVDTANDAIVTTDSQGNIVLWNPAAERMFGYSCDEVVGKPVTILVPKGSEQNHIKALKTLFSIKKFEFKGKTVELVGSRKDGTEFPVEISVSSWRSGDELFFTAIIRDITKRKKAEDALRKSEELLRAVFDASNEVIFVKDTAGRYTHANAAFSRIFGMTVEKIIGKKDSDIFPADEANSIKEIDREVIEKGISITNEDVLTIRGEKRIFSTTKVPLRDASGNIIGLCGFAEDVTQRRRAEEALRKALERNVELRRQAEQAYRQLQATQKQLIQAQKMEAIGRLAGGIAHDFNNMLVAILGNIELMMMKLSDDDPLYRHLEQMRIAAERAADLTNKLLLFSRKQPMEFKAINLNETINDLVEMLKPIIGENIKVKKELEGDIWSVNADSASIEQVITNIIVNAKDAMPDGGELTIKTENVTIDEHKAEPARESRPGNFVRVTIADTGVGMDGETMQHIFEPFFTTKKSGTGLGLSVAYGIIKQHGGWIEVRSAPGSGSAFMVYLPAVPTKSVEKPVKERPEYRFEPGGEKILLIEDEEVVRNFLMKTLTENNYTVFCAANAKEATEIFEKEKGDFNLVICDVVLPDESGIKLVTKFLSKNKKLKILLSSGYLDVESQWSIIQHRGFRFLRKPYSVAELLSAIKNTLG